MFIRIFLSLFVTSIALAAYSRYALGLEIKSIPYAIIIPVGWQLLAALISFLAKRDTKDINTTNNNKQEKET